MRKYNEKTIRKYVSITTRKANAIIIFQKLLTLFNSYLTIIYKTELLNRDSELMKMENQYWHSQHCQNKNPTSDTLAKQKNLWASATI